MKSLYRGTSSQRHRFSQLLLWAASCWVPSALGCLPATSSATQFLLPAATMRLATSDAIPLRQFVTKSNSCYSFVHARPTSSFKSALRMEVSELSEKQIELGHLSLCPVSFLSMPFPGRAGDPQKHRPYSYTSAIVKCKFPKYRTSQLYLMVGG